MILRLLDKLAGRWLDWRTDRAITSDPELQKFKLHRVGINSNGIEIMAYAPGIAIFADQASELLNAAHAKNYVQFDMLPRLDRGLRPVRVTVQWAYGMSPVEKNAKLQDALRQLIPIAESAMQVSGDMGVYGDSLYGADPSFHLQVAEEQGHVITTAKALLA